MKISTVAQMREMDATAIGRFGIAEDLLMENAGHAAFAVLASRMGPVFERSFVVVCGLGNNGGDGLVVARHIHSHGGQVEVLLLGDPERFRGAARRQMAMLERLPVPILRLPDAEGLAERLAAGEVLVDALFGTGLSREIDGLHREVVEAINASGRPVLSLDIPSGVQGDTGQILGCAVQASHTVTFGLPKAGNLLYPGFACGGHLHVAHIGMPRELLENEALQLAVNLPPPLPCRSATGHKGSFGQALFIAGAAGYLGAPCFAALSFLKAGGGYSRLAAPAGITPFIAMKGSEIVFLPQRETAGGSLALANREALLATAAGQDFVVLGPGLSLDEETQQLARELTAATQRPLLIDGDGLTAVAAHPELLQQRRAPTVLTPHPGEMARLTGLSIGAIETDRVAAVRRGARDLNAMVVLKGAHSLIGCPDGRVFINLSGNSGLASAGSGDVLTGTIAASFCLGLPLPEAVCKGVLLHGLAGDLAAAARGEDGMTAQDILDYLPLALRADRSGLPPHLARRYAGPELIF